MPLLPKFWRQKQEDEYFQTKFRFIVISTGVHETVRRKERKGRRKKERVKEGRNHELGGEEKGEGQEAKRKVSII